MAPHRLHCYTACLGVVFTLWWLPNAASQDFNLTWMDVVLVVISLILILQARFLFYALSQPGGGSWLILQ